MVLQTQRSKHGFPERNNEGSALIVPLLVQLIYQSILLLRARTSPPTAGCRELVVAFPAGKAAGAC